MPKREVKKESGRKLIGVEGLAGIGKWDWARYNPECLTDITVKIVNTMTARD